VTKIGELGTTQAATSNRRTLRRNTNGISSQRASVASLYIQEDGILHSHYHKNVKSYIELTGWAL
jgi:hypothetical protein